MRVLSSYLSIQAFASSTPSAAIVTVWPSGTNHIDTVSSWLRDSKAHILLKDYVDLKSPLSEILSVMALYDREEWLESNCWYMEQPLPGGPPDGPFSGAEWKRQLCFRNLDRNLFVFIIDVAECNSNLWSGKYIIRNELAKMSGNPGNSCIHITDDQSSLFDDSGRIIIDKPLGRGMACNDSYAYKCAKVLLNPSSQAFLNSDIIAALEFGGVEFRR
jgi:hypothetical protein